MEQAKFQRTTTTTTIARFCGFFGFHLQAQNSPFWISAVAWLKIFLRIRPEHFKRIGFGIRLGVEFGTIVIGAKRWICYKDDDFPEECMSL